MDDFGKRLKELRTQNHLSQEALAKELGVTAQAVSKWEKGRSSPDFAAIVPLARLFRISTDQLLGYEGLRRDWELRWQRAMIAGDPAEARRIAADAQRELPMAGHFSCRQAESEAVIARNTADPEEKRQLLASAERRLRDILKEYPEYEGAALKLMSVLLEQGRRQEAETLARSFPGGVFTLLTLLGEAASEEQKLRAITARAAQFHTVLLDSRDLQALELAERFLTEFPWNEADRARLLSGVFAGRAALLCGMGDREGAMAALVRMRELMRPEEPSGEKDAAASPLTFLRLTPEQGPEADRAYWRSLLKDPRLQPLEGMEEYRELLALAEM